MSKYFVVNDIKVASIMAKLLDIDFYAFYSATAGRDIYTFPRVKDIGKIYGRALKIVEDMKKELA
ncbi:hypothetical protein [Clostridium butyricum]|nr:hypothetical protein [Clostridium butyricum]DAR44409.1 MAG TPA: hypothetical protein [Caudoviricetes sp.]